ncbi:MAG: autotransporter domain-containing protein [Opitutales bacterium]
MPTLSKLSLIAAAFLTAAAASAAVTDVHPVANPTDNTWTNAVSSDGLTSVGYTDIGGGFSAYKLVGSTLTTLPPLAGHSSAYARAASANGSLIVGYSVDSSSYNQAVSWTGTPAVATALDATAAFIESEARGVSADGLTIVGWGYNATSFSDEAFYHQAGSIHHLGILFGGLASKANGVSADGTIIVGTIADDFSLPNAVSGFVYTIGGSSTLVQADIGIPAFGSSFLNFTQLTAISGDGTVAVGQASSGLNSGDAQAFKYTVAGASYVALGTLGGAWSKANAVNGNGSVIVGQSSNGNGNPEAFVHQNGVMTGLGFLSGGSISSATGVSADGSVIVGFSNTTGNYKHAFVYANQTMLDADEWLGSLTGPGSILAMTTNLNLLPLEGAHHRPLMSYDSMGKQSQAWATGDFGTSSRQVDQHKTSGEIGVSQTYGDFVLGLAAGHASLNQDLAFGGNASISGNYLLAEADYRLADKESIASLVLMRGDWSADTTRGYATGGGTDTSTGSTGLKTTSARLRLDGPAQKFVSAISATPFVSYTVTRTTADAYAEAGGSFPASFAAQEHTAQEGRLGVTAKYVATPSTTLLFTAEWIHRFDGAGAGLTATSATLGTLTAADIAPTANQARFGFDIDHKLSADTLLNLSLHAAGTGPSADFAAALSVRRAF